jgi:hypothetical protein
LAYFDENDPKRDDRELNREADRPKRRGPAALDCSGAAKANKPAKASPAKTTLRRTMRVPFLSSAARGRRFENEIIVGSFQNETGSMKPQGRLNRRSCRRATAPQVCPAQRGRTCYSDFEVADDEGTKISPDRDARGGA